MLVVPGLGSTLRLRVSAARRTTRGSGPPGPGAREPAHSPTADRSVPRRHRGRRPAVAGGRRHRRARRRKDHARAAGAPRRGTAHPAAAAPRRRARDCCAHRRRARLDDRPRGRLADSLRAPLRRRDAPARRHRGRADGAPAAGSAPLGFPHGRPRRVPRAQRSRRPRARAREAGVARARRPAPRRDVGDARRRRRRARFSTAVPVIDVPGRLHPLEIAYAPGQTVADAALDLAAATGGDVLCFLPGAAEIRRAMSDISSRVRTPPASPSLPLYGALDAAEQDAALRPSASRRIVVATNLAETSVTVPGVTAVVDAGLHKVARYDADRADRQPRARAHHRRTPPTSAPGRAGREAPGRVRRLWDARDRLRPHREPEIHRVDLSAVVLDVIAWGGDPVSARMVRAAEGRRARRGDGAARAARRRRPTARLTDRGRADPAPAAPSAAGADARRRRRRARRWRGPRRSCPSATSSRRARPRRRRTCCRRSTTGAPCRRTCSASRARSKR